MAKPLLGVTDVGDPESPAILLGHGFFLDRSMWAGVAEVLVARGWRVITWDAPGHGQSPPPDGEITYWDMAGAAWRVLDHLGVERAIVGGLSQGGYIALRQVLQAPERAAGLILFDTEAHPLSDVDEAAFGALFGGLAEHGPVDELLVPLSHQLIGDVPEAAVWRDRWKRRPLPLGEPVRTLLSRDDIRPRLGEITCPTLLLRGAEDASIPRERMEFLHREIPHATEVHEIPGAHHVPPLSHPAEVTRTVLDWLASL